MKVKILSILVIFLFVTLVIPFSTAVYIPVAEPIDTKTDTFIGCYIEASGEVSTVDWPRIIGSNMWKLTWLRPFGNDFAVISYWRIVLDESTELSIYDEEGGELLYQHDGVGHPQLRIIGYFGDYTPTSPDENTLHVELSGSAFYILKNVK